MRQIKFLMIFIFLNLSLSAFSQEAPKKTTIEFLGVVMDSESGRIEKVTILVEGEHQKWQLESDEKGEFKLEMPTGKYTITLTALHFKKMIFKNFEIDSESKVRHEFKMELGACSDCGEWFKTDDPPNSNALLLSY
jgi:Carboxypeptidase regulatory-like domain